MDSDERKYSTPPEMSHIVQQAFLILTHRTFLEVMEPYIEGEEPWVSPASNAAQGLRSIISAANLPFNLIHHSNEQRHFDRIRAAERIRALPIVKNPEGGLNEEQEKRALATARERMREFLESEAGSIAIQDGIVLDLHYHLLSPAISAAARELQVQSIIGAWSVFESFARSFVVAWVNDNPKRAAPILASADLKDLFGKQVVDIQTIGDHDYDLTRSMGTILLRGRRLDSLSSVKGIMKALFDSQDVQVALGQDMWLLNQRRHLFVHNRGIADLDYIKQTGDDCVLGEPIAVNSDMVERHLETVRDAIVKICQAAKAYP